MTSPPHQTDRPSPPSPPRLHHVPPGTGTFGMVLFLLALAMLFASSMLLYIVFRLTAVDGPPLGSVELPGSLWVSTTLILISSYTIHRALQSVRHERQTAFRNAMVLTLLLGVGFLVVQAPSLTRLITEHRDQLNLGDAGIPLYGLVFFLVLVHAAHVIGGLAPMALLTINAHAGRYDHESHAPIKYLAMYWHFLDIVWVLMFVMLLVAA